MLESTGAFAAATGGASRLSATAQASGRWEGLVREFVKEDMEKRP